MTTLRGLNSRHSPPLIETRFATDPLEWTTRPYRWPVWLTLLTAFVISGIVWALVLVLGVEVAAIVRSLA